jgi:hypothetical protein
MNRRVSDQQLITLALMPVAAGTALYTLWANGFIFDLPFSVPVSIATPSTDLSWLDNGFRPLQVGGSVMLAFIGVLVVGFIIVTWLTMMAVDAAKTTREQVKKYQVAKRGTVTGLVRPTEKHAWSSRDDAVEDVAHYSTRGNGWVRRQLGESEDKTSGVLTK